MELKEEYKEYTLGLALFDLVPVLVFLMTGILIWSMYGSPVFLAGVTACFAGGLSKAVWKILVVCLKKDVHWLAKAFRILMAGGFALMLLALVISVTGDAVRGPVSSGALPGNPGSGTTLSALFRALSIMPAPLFFIAGTAGMCLMGYLGKNMDSSVRSNWIEEIVNAISQILILIGVVIVYFGSFYHASDIAAEAMKGTDTVQVIEAGDRIMFDGPGTEDVLVFYQGAKVEAESYAPLMSSLAERGIDCCLCRMPLNFALFDEDKAGEIREELTDQASGAGKSPGYENWYIGGHSLGGVAAADHIAGPEKEGDNAPEWNGIVFLASYPAKKVTIPSLVIDATEDCVAKSGKIEEAEAKGLFPEDLTKYTVQGGNHAGFGSYGAQKGDGEALISPEEQTEVTADQIAAWIGDM